MAFEGQNKLEKAPSLSWPAMSSLAQGMQVPQAPTAASSELCLSCWFLLTCFTRGTRLCSIDASITTCSQLLLQLLCPSAVILEA